MGTINKAPDILESPGHMRAPLNWKALDTCERLSTVHRDTRSAPPSPSGKLLILSDLVTGLHMKGPTACVWTVTQTMPTRPSIPRNSGIIRLRRFLNTAPSPGSAWTAAADRIC